MYHDDIMKLRDRQKGLPLVITLHDGVKLVDGLPGNVIIFDQANEMGYAFRNSNTPYVTKGSKYEMISFKYDMIVNIRTNLSLDEMTEVLRVLEKDAVIENSDIQTILNSVVIDL